MIRILVVATLLAGVVLGQLAVLAISCLDEVLAWLLTSKLLAVIAVIWLVKLGFWDLLLRQKDVPPLVGKPKKAVDPERKEASDEPACRVSLALREQWDEMEKEDAPVVLWPHMRLLDRLVLLLLDFIVMTSAFVAFRLDPRTDEALILPIAGVMGVSALLQLLYFPRAVRGAKCRKAHRGIRLTDDG